MYNAILIPTDGSPAVQSAVARGIDLARTADAAVHSLCVIDTRPEPTDIGTQERASFRTSFEKRARESTAAITEKAVNQGLEAHSEVLEGIPHRNILQYAEEHDIDLVVMGIRGRAGPDPSRLGSTTERVIMLADRPVMAVPDSTDDERLASGYGMYNEVVIPTDGSDAAERASDHGLAISERYGADVHVLYVVDTTTFGLEDAPRSIVGLLKEGGTTAIDEIAAEGRERNLPVTTSLLRGVPEDEISDYATGVEADLIVMGTRGRTGGPEQLLGSTTARMIRRTDIPILTVS